MGTRYYDSYELPTKAARATNNRWTMEGLKRSCSISLTKATSGLLNRVYRRIIIRDYSKPIYKATSRSALLTALAGYIKGYNSLRKAGILYRDISINNLLINEDKDNPS
ncbi:hypothetical protein BN1723_016767 [Verticillium longisporum]|uniref:Fungal-type protein kinase domain-containing protein n=1 Tax=Verticillium longisporum TaxID=100787 RepID=A0A0G4NM33_VERLO|nr:hypothetical protein BN1723_016767 [Verticillium longisporum]